MNTEEKNTQLQKIKNYIVKNFDAGQFGTYYVEVYPIIGDPCLSITIAKEIKENYINGIFQNSTYIKFLVSHNYDGTLYFEKVASSYKWQETTKNIRNKKRSDDIKKLSVYIVKQLEKLI